MTLPNFLIIGAAKAGTTALHYYLRQHRQIFMPQNKEPGFFAYQGRLPAFAGPGDDQAFPYLVLNMPHYQQLFAESTFAIARGEASTAYLYHPQAAERILRTIPNIKLITILRHPVERAYSSYLQMMRDGREPLADFGEALRAEPQRISAGWNQIWHYREMGYYGRQLKRYFDRFPRTQVQVFLYEEFQKQPRRILEMIFQFLGVNEKDISDIEAQMNVSGIPKYKSLYGIFVNQHPFRAFLRGFVPYEIRKFLNHKLAHWPLTKPSLSPEIRQQLMADFRDDLLELQTLLEHDLTTWLT